MHIVGVVTRNSVSDEGHSISIVYNDIMDVIFKNGAIPIGIKLNENYKNVIDICDGIIFSGGDNFEEYDLKVLKYIYEKDIPVLGICLGMQLMGVLFDGTMIDIPYHKKNLNYVHGIYINENSKLYNIFNEKYIKVNSRHKSVIKNTKLDIVGISGDNRIEAIEDKSRRFFLGVQWHPESMLKYDEKQENIFKTFIKCL